MAFNPPTAGFSLGIDGPTNASPRRWNHEISDARVYQRALNTNEVYLLSRPSDGLLSVKEGPPQGSAALAATGALVANTRQALRATSTLISASGALSWKPDEPDILMAVKAVYAGAAALSVNVTPGPSLLQSSAAFAGAGALLAPNLRKVLGSWTVAGAGSMALGPNEPDIVMATNAAFAGTGGLVTPTLLKVLGPQALNGNSSLTLNTIVRMQIASALAGTAALNADASISAPAGIIYQAESALAASANLIAANTVLRLPAQPLAFSGSAAVLAANTALRLPTQPAPFASTATLAAASRQWMDTDAILAASGALTAIASGVTAWQLTSSFSASAALVAATGQRLDTAAILAASAALTANTSGVTAWQLSSSFSAAGAVVAPAGLALPALSALQAVGTVSATSRQLLAVLAAFGGASGLTANAAPARAVTAAMAASATFGNVATVMRMDTDAVLAAAASLAVVAQTAIPLASSFSAAAALAAVQTTQRLDARANLAGAAAGTFAGIAFTPGYWPANAVLAGVSSLAAQTSQFAQARSALTAAGTLAALVGLRYPIAIPTLTSSATLTSASIAYMDTDAVLAGAGALVGPNLYKLLGSVAFVASGVLAGSLDKAGVAQNLTIPILSSTGSLAYAGRLAMPALSAFTASSNVAVSTTQRVSSLAVLAGVGAAVSPLVQGMLARIALAGAGTVVANTNVGAPNNIVANLLAASSLSAPTMQRMAVLAGAAAQAALAVATAQRLAAASQFSTTASLAATSSLLLPAQFSAATTGAIAAAMTQRLQALLAAAAVGAVNLPLAQRSLARASLGGVGALLFDLRTSAPNAIYFEAAALLTAQSRMRMRGQSALLASAAMATVESTQRLALRQRSDALGWISASTAQIAAMLGNLRGAGSQRAVLSKTLLARGDYHAAGRLNVNLFSHGVLIYPQHIAGRVSNKVSVSGKSSRSGSRVMVAGKSSRTMINGKSEVRKF